MKKSTLAFVLVLLLLGAYFSYDSNWGRSLWTGLVSKDRQVLNDRALSFMEDIRFKDFEKAASYHHPEDQEKADIPRLIERLFKIKPELLDIMEYHILETALDSTGKRARVKISSKVHLLNSDEIKQPEMILYFHNRDEKWYMELESSLR